MTPQSSLFPETDEARIERLDAEILHLLTGNRGGPLNLTLEDNEKAMLAAVRYSRGLARAITIREIQLRHKLTAREIKAAARTLRMNFHIPIGSSKHSTDGGYFLIVTAADQRAWSGDVLDQVRAELAVLKAVAGPRAHLELLGQLHMEAQNEASTEAANAL